VPYIIYPPIGIARLGNSDDFFVGAEQSGSVGTERLPNGTEQPVASFKDAQYRVKRQAARFQIFETLADGSHAPAHLPANTTVRWSVQVINKKDAVKRPGSPPSSAQRPVLAPGRADRIIDSGVVPAPGVLRGSYRAQPVDLGELRLDTSDRLLVLGARGRSASPTGAPIGGSFYNNPDWYDDVADGPVRAEIELPDGTVQQAVPAWVIVAPPDFAPACRGVVTLHDLMSQIGADLGDITLPARPNFGRDIQPLLERTANLRWVDNGATWPLVSTDWIALADPSAGAAPLRAANASYVRAAESLLHDFTICPWQHDVLTQYEAGNFDTAPVPAAASVADDVTRAALDATVGQGFYPGIEAGVLVTDPSLYLRPFAYRLDTTQVSPGDLTALMALPWQADFLKCNSGWWPTQRPDVAPQPDGTRPMWLRPAMNHAGLVQDVMRLGVITPTGTGSHVEADRDPAL
jgi:hypothetical protein